MKTRIIVAVVCLPLLFAVTLLLPETVTVLIVGIFAAVGAYELLYNTKLVRNFRMVTYTMIMALMVPFWSYYGCLYPIALGGMLVFYALIFSELMLSGGKIPFSRGSICFMGGIVIPYLFSALARIMAMEINRNFILLPFVVAFLADGGAYFVGITLGKHKLAPVISPKKTVEGFFGGLAAAVLGTLVYGLIQQFAYGLQVNYAYAIVYGLVGALAGVFGDLSFSVIKRQTGIKDYGNLFPGHGGVLDRFDSVICVAPLIEFLLLVLPMAS